MQKIVRILEANVEWFALGLAVLYLGWMAYSYLMIDPVSKTLEGTEVSPGNVDAFIDSHAAQRLRDAMNPDVEPPKFEVKDFNLALQSSINLDQLNAPQLATSYFD